MNSLLVMLGGALGSLARYQFGRISTISFGAHFPFGTLGVNIIGGLLMGMLVGGLARMGAGAEPLRLLLGVGFLGGFTTFSAYSVEIVLMMERGQLLLALTYAGLSVILALIAVFAGLMLMRSNLA